MDGTKRHLPGCLAGDQAIYPNCAAFAWQGMSSAADHLGALRALWLDAGHGHALADATLPRAALLGAATSVCLLDDSPGVDRRSASAVLDWQESPSTATTSNTRGPGETSSPSWATKR